MKQITQYITEKANFLVKKHITKQQVSFYEKILQLIDDCFGEFDLQSGAGYDMDNKKWSKSKYYKSQYYKRFYKNTPNGFWNDFKPVLEKKLKSIAEEYNYEFNTELDSLTIIGETHNGSPCNLIEFAGENKSTTISIQIWHELVPDEDVI